jgi:hypothetical protein
MRRTSISGLSRHSRAAFAFVLLVIALALGRTASAQITAATISGVITDETGAVLSGVDVFLKNLEARRLLATMGRTTFRDCRPAGTRYGRVLKASPQRSRLAFGWISRSRPD